MESLKKSKKKKRFLGHTEEQKKPTFGWYEGESDAASVQQKKL